MFYTNPYQQTHCKDCGKEIGKRISTDSERVHDGMLRRCRKCVYEVLSRSKRRTWPLEALDENPRTPFQYGTGGGHRRNSRNEQGREETAQTLARQTWHDEFKVNLE